LGGSTEEESFEIQIKVKITDPEIVKSSLSKSGIQIIRKKHYHQHDVYFNFIETAQGWLRYREDELVDDTGRILSVRSRLTLIGPSREGDFAHDVLLSRIRYFAPATNSLRFYREYFKPGSETQIDKDRLRWLIQYKGEEFFINLDYVKTPELGYYLEIKSRTWSRIDAQEKAECTTELINLLGGLLENTVTLDYVEIAEKSTDK